MKRFLLCCLLLSFFMCALVKPADAAEVLTLKNTASTDVYDYLLSENLKKGFNIQSLSEYTMVFEDSRRKNFQFTLNWGSDAKVLHIFNVAPTGKNVIVSYEVQILSHPGTADETLSVASLEGMKTISPFKEDLLQGYKMTKSTLRTIKAIFNGMYMYGFSYELKFKQIQIVKVWPDTPAGKSGLLVGDKIVKINDIDLTTLEDEMIHTMLMSGEEGATIRLLVIRNEQEIPLTLTKQFLPPSFKSNS